MMSDRKGWIKFFRSILDNPVAMKSLAHFGVWCILLLTATSKSRKIWFDGKEIVLKPGQLITGRKQISEFFKDLNESKVQRVLKDFENAQQIEQQTTFKNRLITLKNWDKYQSGEQPFEQQLNSKRTATEQQLNSKRTLNKNVKNRENIKNVENEREDTLAPLGRFKNVILTQNELDELKGKFPNDYEAKIERLSRYLESTGKHYDNHFATLLEWLEKDTAEISNDKNDKRTSSYDLDELDKIDTLDNF